MNGLQHYVNIQAVPLKDTAEPYFLIVFQSASSTGIQQVPFETNLLPEDKTYNLSELRIEQLEKELAQARADMRAITEEQETANEELQSANEELLSGSEELQSLNEELETSQEELQSTNEEIMIVNTELLDRNEQLNSARLYTESIVNTIRDPLLILDSDLRVKRATDGFYKKFRTSEKDTEGQYIYDLGNKQWDIPRLKEILEDVLPSKKEFMDFEVTHVFPHIGKKIMLLNARQIDNVNNEKLILLAIEDITDKRKVEEGLAEAERLLSESKERLKFAIDSAGLGTWDYDPQAKVLVWDKRCREIFVLSSTDLIDLPSFIALMHQDDRTRVEKSINETLQGENNGEFDIEFRTVPINEKIKWLKAKGRAYFDEKGEPVRFIGTILDITVQKLIDVATLELLNKKDEFISIASHELKTPITSLKAALQMIERTTPQTKEMKTALNFLQKAIKQVDKLIELIKDLLDVTKIQSGKLELKKTKFNLGELIAECCDEIQNSSPNHKLIVEGETNFEILADKNRLEQVIVNLLSNAIKYSPEGEQVIIEVNKSESGIKIAVTDFGIGIPKDKQQFLFDRFYRVDENTQKYSGLGLGLFISSQIIKQHNSNINIESEVGKGSTFWFILPV